MPHHKAQKKSLKTDARKHSANKSALSRCRTLEKNLRKAIESGDKDIATGLYPGVQKALDQAVGHNLYKKETVSRKKSRLLKALNQLSA